MKFSYLSIYLFLGFYFAACTLDEIESVTIHISSITPTMGTFGDTIAISGGPFSSILSSNEILFTNSNISTNPFEVNEDRTQLKLVVPEEVSTGPIRVSVNGQVAENQPQFTLFEFQVFNIFPKGGSPGDTVRIEATSFSPNLSENQVLFFGSSSPVNPFELNVGQNQISVIVPADARTGIVEVSTEGNTASNGPNFIVIPPSVRNITSIFEDTRWNGRINLDGFVVVEEGVTLTIDPGTVIQAKQGIGIISSALVISRGAKIMARGTKESPIIFTTELDDPLISGDIGREETGLWGGLIILGNASLNSFPGESTIAGFPDRAYGAKDLDEDGIFETVNDEDNSGVLSYISIRHSGARIDNFVEVSSFTLGGVGNGTQIDHIEIYAGQDDGIEFFGGTVNTKFIVSSFNEDDAFDYNEGYRGKNQFWFALQTDQSTLGRTNWAGEHCGGTMPETGRPFATPIIYNATYIGETSSSSDLIVFRDNAGGEYHNSIFTEYDIGIQIEKLVG